MLSWITKYLIVKSNILCLWRSNKLSHSLLMNEQYIWMIKTIYLRKFNYKRIKAKILTWDMNIISKIQIMIKWKEYFIEYRNKKLKAETIFISEKLH
jgi:hypothetical protein